jgi:hypothetical protein
MAEERAEHPDIFAGPTCNRCGGATRLLRIERHRRRKRSHVWTFECTACGAIDEVEIPIPQRPH